MNLVDKINFVDWVNFVEEVNFEGKANFVDWDISLFCIDMPVVSEVIGN